jgi:hypothetical protein
MSRFMSALGSARSLLFTPGRDERKLVRALQAPVLAEAERNTLDGN